MQKFKHIISSLIFFLTGFFFSSTNHVRAIEHIGSWTNTTNLPYSLANHPSFITKGKILITGGSTTFVRQDVISSLVLPGGNVSGWNTDSSDHLPVNLFWHSSVVKDDYVYVLGGAIYPSSLVNSVDSVFRGTIDASGNITEWVSMTPLPKRLTSGSAVLVGDKIYYTGGGTWTNGWAGVVLSNIVYVNTIDSSGNLGDWQIAGNLPNPTVQHVSLYTGSKLIIIGGAYNTSWSPNNKVYSFPINPDGTLGAWTQLPLLKIPVRYPMLGNVDNTIIVAGGVTTGNLATNEVYYSQINPSGDTGEWTLSDNRLPKINCCTGSATWNDYMYITGGHDNISLYYDTTWSAKIDVSALSPTPTQTPTLTPTPTPTPTLTPTPPIPVVFLPGLGASFNFKNMFLGEDNLSGWIMTPGAKSYDNLLKTFAGENYFWTFYYDWRKPVIENSQKLNDYIKNTVQPWNNKVNLVGHSLGGLIARTCIQKTENNCYVEKLITVGSPHAGAVDAYPALEGGEIWRTGPVKLGYELFIRYNQRPGETKRDTLERITPVLKDLLPSFDYLTKNGLNLPPSSLSYLNSLLPQIQDLSELENKTTTIAGSGYETVERIILENPNWIDKLLGNWPDGKPKDKILTLEGDTSVLVKSASFSNPDIENFGYNLDHGGIISWTDPLQKILDILNLGLTVTSDDSKDSENYLVFYVHSPVKISLADLPSGAYAEDEIIIIPDPESANFQLNVLGTRTGQYQLSVGQIIKENTFWSDYFNNITIGETQNYNFAIDIQNPSENPLSDYGGLQTKNFVKSLIEELKKEINKLTLTKGQKHLLLIPLTVIKPDNPEVSLVFLGSFRNIVAAYENKGLIPEEKADYFRNRCSSLSEYLETLAMINPKITKKNIAESSLKLARKAKALVKTSKLSKSAFFVFDEGERKLTIAEESYTAKNYFKTKIFANQATSLFVESRNIR